MIGLFTSPIVSLVTNQNTAATLACSKRRENKVYMRAQGGKSGRKTAVRFYYLSWSFYLKLYD